MPLHRKFHLDQRSTFKATECLKMICKTMFSILKPPKTNPVASLQVALISTGMKNSYSNRVFYSCKRSKLTKKWLLDN